MRARIIGFFWNRQASRLRLPWRLGIAVVVLFGLGILLTILTPSLRPSLEAVFTLFTPSAHARAAADTVLLVSTLTITTVGTVYVVGRFIDRRRFSDFGLHLDRSWWRDLGFGLVLGAVLMAGIFVIELAAGWVVITGTFRVDQPGFAFWPGFGWALLTFVTVGVTEEVLTRGYLIKNLAEGLTWSDRIGFRGAVTLAIIGSGILFAGAHAANPNATLASAVGIFLASVMLASGYVLTGELGIPIGIHVTWNFFQGPVFGLPVSGIDVGVSVLAIEQQGPAIVTGGSFGPEAGVLGAFASLGGTGLIVAWASYSEDRVRFHPAVTTPDRRGGREP